VQWRDTLELASTSLRQRPWRTALTVLGIVLGTMLLFVAGAGRSGVQAAIERQVSSYREIRTIQVSPQSRGSMWKELPLNEQPELPGGMSDERRRRLLQSLRMLSHGPVQPGPEAEQEGAKLLASDLAKWQGWSGVEAVEPLIYFSVEVRQADVVRLRRAFVLPLSAEILPPYLVAGRLVNPQSVDEVLVDEAQVYQWGFHDEASVPQSLGTSVQLAFHAAVDRSRAQSVLFRILAEVDDLTEAETQGLQRARAAAREIGNLMDLPDELLQAIEPILDRHPELRSTDRTPLAVGQFHVVGVFRPVQSAVKGIAKLRMGPGLSSVGIFLSPAAASKFLQSQLGDSVPITGALVIVDSETNLRSVVERLEAEGYKVDSLLELVEKIRSRIELVSAALSTLAAVAVVLAALGIAKSVASSIVERTREIAVMKAIGAEDRQVRRLFLMEGALLGGVGGGLGLLVGWIATLRLDAWVRSYLEQRLQQPVTDQVFFAPWWLWLSVPLLVTGVAMLAVLLPSRRATRIDPALALRYE
jgi:putative ABC transport system permease protein